MKNFSYYKKKFHKLKGLKDLLCAFLRLVSNFFDCCVLKIC